MTDIVERLRAGEACGEISSEYACGVKTAASGCQCAMAADEIERLRALLKEVDDWVRDLEPFADAGHEPVTVFKKVRAALAQEKPND